MTALIYSLAPQGVWIAMDTLVVRPDNKRPIKFVTKIYPIPHLTSVMCGTGVMQFALHWSNTIQTKVVGTDITSLDDLAPAVLPQMAAHYGISKDQTSTIYHFGFAKNQGRFVGFAYRSTNGFKSEVLQDGIGFKPHSEELKQLATTVLDSNKITDMIALMTGQKAMDDGQSVTRRLGIGGEIQLLLLDEAAVTVRVIHRFPDYDTVLAEILSTPQNLIDIPVP